MMNRFAVNPRADARGSPNQSGAEKYAAHATLEQYRAYETMRTSAHHRAKRSSLKAELQRGSSPRSSS